LSKCILSVIKTVLRKRWFCHEQLWEAARNGTI